MNESYNKKYLYGNTLFNVILCNEDDEKLLAFFERNVKKEISTKEEMYRWLISHDIYFFVRYIRKDRFVISHLLSLHDFKRNKKIYPPSNKALAKYESDDELIQELVLAFSSDGYHIVEM
ncbi:hypothetical protein [Butyrivibrio sp. TB]|uniref:hypothetical protein n=1 Tax=Butyrivibrio sp. TB TaxID=1520809 RepID=UPI0008C061B7|nr:hypothetical protein [Butyrivibrio sp. TB]SEQ23715.1 hypothetical protein SAMN02910382_02405 [Butyrivibrio sp. TB]